MRCSSFWRHRCWRPRSTATRAILRSASFRLCAGARSYNSRRERIYFATGFGLIQVVKGLMSFEDEVSHCLLYQCSAITMNSVGPACSHWSCQARKCGSSAAPKTLRCITDTPRWPRTQLSQYFWRRFCEVHDRRGEACRANVRGDFVREGKVAYTILLGSY